MRCNHCGKELPEGAVSCRFCGAELTGAAAGKSDFDDIPLDLSHRDSSDLFSNVQKKDDYVEDPGAADYDFGTFADGINIDEPEDEPHDNDGLNDSFGSFDPEKGYDDSYRGQKRKSLLWLWITLAVVAVAAVAVVLIIVLNGGEKKQDVLPATADQTAPATVDQTAPASPDEIAGTVPATVADATEAPVEESYPSTDSSERETYPETKPDNEYDDLL